MRGLIDTSTFLWFISGDSRLSHTAKTIISEIDNEIFLSIASLWEIAIKTSIGKLELSMSYEDLLSTQIEDNEIKLLQIEKNHLKDLVRLPFYHRDPFDRLIISQGIAENLPILTCDRLFNDYPIETLW
ncbi:MAG: type II toxin-antitoxin system VapC family toxin [Candidatus Aminicenantes bacterium]|jgi:PIN domain nuclease of toxin-antitoxin system